MIFTQVTKPEKAVALDLIGPRTLKITYESGKVWTVSSVVWSTVSSSSSAPNPTDGILNFAASGGIASRGLIGIEVSVANPITVNSVVYTNIVTLTDYLITNFAF